MTGDGDVGKGTDPESLWTVTYRPERSDMLTTYRTMARRRLLRHGPILALVFAALGTLLGWAIGLIGLSRPAPAAAIGAALGVGALVALLVRAERRAVGGEQAASYCISQTLTIHPEGFEHTREDGLCHSGSWSEVPKVGTTKTDFVIFIGEHTGLAVPLRAFRSEGQRYLFVKFAGAWHAQATDVGTTEAATTDRDR